MKRITLPFLTILLATSTFAKSFEGVVRYEISSGKRSNEMEYAIKGDRMRMTMDVGEKQSVDGIIDTKAGEVYVMIPGQNMYMVFGGIGDMAAKGMPTDAEINETGRTETIAGYKCSEYIITDKDSTTELWATEGLGRFVSIADMQKSRGKSPAWTQILMEKDLFPLRTINKDKRGRVRSTMEATLVEPKTLAADLFEIPEGYKKFEMPNLGGLLKGLRP